MLRTVEREINTRYDDSNNGDDDGGNMYNQLKGKAGVERYVDGLSITSRKSYDSFL